jgi:hypothetical protein
MIGQSLLQIKAWFPLGRAAGCICLSDGQTNNGYWQRMISFLAFHISATAIATRIAC